MRSGHPRRHTWENAFGLMLLLLGSIAVSTHVHAQDPAVLSEARGQWSLHGRTPDEQRYSPLKQIDVDNVKRLGLAWYFDLGTRRGLEATPLLADGVLYFTGTWSRVFAVDARSGKLLWRYDPKVPPAWAVNACCDVVNRGVALHGDKVYVGTLDGRLVALDRASGKPVWEVLTIDPKRPYTITGAPRVVRDKILIGNGGAEFGVRGYVTAYDAETGIQAWRFWTVPGNPTDGFESPDVALAAETWHGGKWWVVGGGGTVWDSMAYDPQLNLLYVGVGNGAPWNRWLRSPGGGDNLYLSSIVAINPDTGRRVWHYQTTPGEAWDYTATQHMILADLTIDGQQRKVLMQAPKNGFFYVLDRATGKLLSAKNYVPVNWATGVDMQTGRPVEADSQYRDQTKLTRPSPFGGHNWQPMAFSPRTGLVYIPAMQIPFKYAQEKDFQYGRNRWNMGVDMALAVPPADTNPQLVRNILRAMAHGQLLAWDPVRQEAVWQVARDNPWNGGLLATAGDLVFQGDAKGHFSAFRAQDGELLWQADAQSGIIAPPISYELDGVQYVAVLAGWGGALALQSGVAPRESARVSGRLLVYALDGKATLPPPPSASPLPALPPRPTDITRIARGHMLYHSYCFACHGMNAEGGVLPDLRSVPAAIHKQFNAIVMDGLFTDLGMVAWRDRLSQDDADAIHAYLIERSYQLRETEDESSLRRTLYRWLGRAIAWYTDLTS